MMRVNLAWQGNKPESPQSFFKKKKAIFEPTTSVDYEDVYTLHKKLLL